MTTQPNTPSQSPATAVQRCARQAPDFKKIRSYMSNQWERKELEWFIAEGWTAEELGEYARQWRLNCRTYPTAQAYQLAVSPNDREWARSMLKHFRDPGYELPPFDRLDDDDPNNPDHTPETRAEVETLARLVMARNDALSWRNTERGPEHPIPKRLWMTCYRAIAEHGSLEGVIDIYRGLERAVETMRLRARPV